MHKWLIPFLAAITFTSSAESREIDCNSPLNKISDLWKDKIKQLRKYSIRPSINDLRGADITRPYWGSATGNVYAAGRGKDFIDCDVSFKDDTLLVNNGTGITREKLIRVTMERVCCIHTFGIEDWIKSTKKN